MGWGFCKKSQKDVVFVTIKCIYKYHISGDLLIHKRKFFILLVSISSDLLVSAFLFSLCAA